MMNDSLSAVDEKTEMKIMKQLRKERADKTTLIAAHRLSAVKHADHIVVIDEGIIVEEGTHEQLLQLNGWYQEQNMRQQSSGRGGLMNERSEERRVGKGGGSVYAS